MLITNPLFRPIARGPAGDLDHIFAAAGHELRLVGGCVRDCLAGHPPKDIDLASGATPEEMSALLKSAGIAVHDTGLKHGTITAVLKDQPFEITTLREDLATNGRHAEVAWTSSFEVDARRRDFTINAMSATLKGELFDYHGGQQDLDDGRLRFVGKASERIEEDHLRILRYFRFAQRFSRLDDQGAHLDKEALSAITNQSPSLKAISVERIWSETSRILTGPQAKAAVDLMEMSGVAAAIDLPTSRSSVLGAAYQARLSPAMTLALLSPEAFDSLAEDWKLSNEEKRQGAFLKESLRLTNAPQKAFKDLLVDGAKSEEVGAILTVLGRRLDADELSKWEIPRFPLGGKDLIQAGIQSGPGMGRHLAELRDHWKEQNYRPARGQLLARLKMVEGKSKEVEIR